MNRRRSADHNQIIRWWRRDRILHIPPSTTVSPCITHTKMHHFYNISEIWESSALCQRHNCYNSSVSSCVYFVATLFKDNHLCLHNSLVGSWAAPLGCSLTASSRILGPWWSLWWCDDDDDYDYKSNDSPTTNSRKFVGEKSKKQERGDWWSHNLSQKNVYDNFYHSPSNTQKMRFCLKNVDFQIFSLDIPKVP